MDEEILCYINRQSCLHPLFLRQIQQLHHQLHSPSEEWAQEYKPALYTELSGAFLLFNMLQNEHIFFLVGQSFQQASAFMPLQWNLHANHHLKFRRICLLHTVPVSRVCAVEEVDEQQTNQERAGNEPKEALCYGLGVVQIWGEATWLWSVIKHFLSQYSY